MPNKLTDAEIVKALKEILEIMLTMGDLQKSATISNTLGLINRQQAEIERLKEKLNTAKAMVCETIPLVEQEIKTTKAEACKEFAYELKQIPHIAVYKREIDDVLRDKIGEGNV